MPVSVSSFGHLWRIAQQLSDNLGLTPYHVDARGTPAIVSAGEFLIAKVFIETTSQCSITVSLSRLKASNGGRDNVVHHPFILQIC